MSTMSIERFKFCFSKEKSHKQHRKAEQAKTSSFKVEKRRNAEMPRSMLSGCPTEKSTLIPTLICFWEHLCQVAGPTKTVKIWWRMQKSLTFFRNVVYIRESLGFARKKLKLSGISAKLAVSKRFRSVSISRGVPLFS